MASDGAVPGHRVSRRGPRLRGSRESLRLRRDACRLAAWLACAAVFAVHLGYEHFRLRNLPARAAWHAAVAVGLGAFTLAVWVNVHARWGGASHQSPFAPLALVLFPLVTGVPAFQVGLAATAILARTTRNAP